LQPSRQEAICKTGNYPLHIDKSNRIAQMQVNPVPKTTDTESAVQGIFKRVQQET